MTKLSETFEEFLTTQTVEMPVVEFIISLVLTAIIASGLAYLFVACGQTLSNRKKFANNFVLLAMTTMIIISIVKSSLALSLGLVGALSIVRFRSAVKDPEELVYLFLTIAVGLGMGAGHWMVTSIGIGAVALVIVAKHSWQKNDEEQNLIVTISSRENGQALVPQVIDVLKQHCTAVDLKRMDVGDNSMEAAFHVAFGSYENLEASRKGLFGLGKSIQLTYLDTRGLV